MTDAIRQRYGELAEQECCLSCGSAVGLCEPRPGDVCIDLGSGRGTDVLRLADAVGPGGHAYGVDATPQMLATARKTAAKLGVTNATFLEAPLHQIPLPDGVADWVISNCTLNHADDQAAVWREIARILKPGGRFVVSDIYAVETIPQQYRNDPAAVAECWAGALGKDEVLAHIGAAGLAGVRILEESAPYAKGKTTVASFTVAGERTAKRCCCSS